ncbi:MAG: hypothetical protein CR986_07300 [Ignavibacteriae bacterium]|nr:MAG: hypothetical protein CR986_07300 [Ignavibacteriota bacterium]
MKKIILLAAILLITSCSKDEKTKNYSSKVKITKSIENIAKKTGPLVKLKYKFAKGKKFSYKMKTFSKKTEIITADSTIKNNIKQEADYKLNLKVLNITEHGFAEIEVRINSITASTNLNGQTIRYDSKMLYSTREKIQFADYEAVKKTPFKIKVDTKGQVVEVTNVNRIIKNIMNIQKIPDTLSAKTKEQMRATIANGTLMPLIQQMFKVIEDKKVGVDSSWQLKYNSPLAVYTAENVALYKVDSVSIKKDTLVYVDSKLVVNLFGNDVVNQNGATYTFTKPIVNANGNFIFDNSKGLVKKTESVTEMEMTMQVEGFDKNNQKITNRKTDITKSKNIVELL